MKRLYLCYLTICLALMFSSAPCASGEHSSLAHDTFTSSLDSRTSSDKKQVLIDPTKVGITGLSSGNDTISFALSHIDRFSAAISSGGTWEAGSYYWMPGWIRAFNRTRDFGRPGSAEDKYWSGMSLGANAEKVNTPLLTLSSDNEALSKMSEYVTLQELGKAVDMYVFPDEFHIKYYPRNRRAVAARAVDWMRFWLQGIEVLDPAKAKQNAHWHTLREQQTDNDSLPSSKCVHRRCDGVGLR